MTNAKTAAERLRDLLDGLNIKHFDYHKGGRTQTLWEAPDGNRHFTYETYDNPARTAKLVISWFPTPEQAVAATLGNDGLERSKNGVAERGTRYERLFGTPERAARTLEKGKALCDWCDKQTCSTSGGECRIFEYDALLEWLRGDAE